MKKPSIFDSRRLLSFGLVAIFVFMGLVFTSLASAQTSGDAIVVNTTFDSKNKYDGKCSLREAIIAANNDRSSGNANGECQAGDGSDVILLPEGVYTLSRSGSDNYSKKGDLDIRGSVTIRPANIGDKVVISASAISDRVFHILSGSVVIERVTIRDGSYRSYGGGVYQQGGNLTIANSTLTGNQASYKGGAIYSRATTTLNHVTVADNNAPKGSGLAEYKYHHDDCEDDDDCSRFKVKNTVLANNGCYGSFINQGNNVAYSANGCPGASGNPELTSESFGGKVAFFVPGEDGSAFDVIGGSCPADQIGTDRPQNAACDIGAIELTDINNPPNATNDTATTPEDNDVNIDVQDNDNAGVGDVDQTLTTDDVSDPANGTAVIEADNTVTYTPDDDFFGPDSFDYRVCDSGGLCAWGTVDVTVNQVNDAPEASPDSATTFEDLSVTINVAANDSDIEDGLDPTSVSVSSDPSSGSAVSVGNGTIVYTPDAHTNGNDSFSYQICDSEPLCSTASVSVTVDPDAYNEVTNVCDNGAGSLRQAIIDANISSDTDNIVFDILDTSCGSDTINLQTELPALNHPAIIDGLAVDSDPVHKPNGSFTPPSTVAYITLEGGGSDFSGIIISSGAGGSTIANLIINNFGGTGILIGDDGSPSDGNTIASNTISNNGGSSTPVTSGTGVTLNDGITVFGVNNQIVDNNIFGSGDLNVDLEGDGSTPNDAGDGDSGANDVQNYPWLLAATPAGEIRGYLNSEASSDFTLNFFVSLTCSGDESIPLSAAPAQFTTDVDGNILFTTDVQAPDSINYGQFIISTATDSSGNTSEYSNCIPIDDDNVVWPNALNISSGDTINQPLIQLGQSRWYRFWVSPNSKVKITLDDLPANYDLVYFGNIGQAYAELIGNADPNLNRLDAEFSTDAFAPATFNPATFNPATFNPATFNPATFNPATFNPATFNPATFNQALFSPDVYSPATFNPATFNPATFNPATFNPATFNPATFNGNAYSAAQMSSVVAASGEDGTAPEEISINSFNSDGWFYIRVRGRQGAFDPNVDFSLGLNIEGGICAGIEEDFNLSTPNAPTNGYETIILTDLSRMDQSDPASAAALNAKLNELAAAVSGVVIDVSADPEVVARNVQADEFNDVTETGYRLCPYAKNVVADGIKEIIDAYRDQNPIKYIVLVGSDDVIPFYRIPDQALLGPEEDYIVPVDINSASEASLRNNYFLSQDGYGAKLGLSVKNDTMPIPNLGVGRLVETNDQIINMIDVFLGGPVLAPQNALVTAYDFLTDGGENVRDDLAASLGAGNVNDSLLVANPDTWTATELDTAIDTFDFDIAFLSGHFSATGALAADYETGYFTSDFLASPLDFSGALLYSAGCHSGYNIVDGHAIPGYTPDNVTDPDWAAAMAEKGITFIGGTGYQYGDTDFPEYSERLYHEFTRQLRSDAAVNISIGDALALAKKQYLINTPKLSGIHQKAVLEATLFGLPMASVNMPGTRLDLDYGSGTLTTANLSAVDNPAIAGDSGEVFGLQSFDLTRNYTLAEINKSFSSVEDENDTVDVSYLQNGPSGFVSSAGEPTLPLDTFDASITDDPNLVLRSVGFLGGDYRDFSDKFPLVGAPTTELSAVHFSFLSFVFYPQQPWSVNRFDSLSEVGGSTLLNILPAQYRTEQSVSQQPPSTQRQFDNMQLRLFYLANDFVSGLDIGSNRPDLAAAPTIVSVSADSIFNGTDFDVEFEVLVIGDPSAGMQDVWVTYTDMSTPTGPGNNGSWQSMFLTQDVNDSKVWQGTLSGISNPQDLRFIAQAVSGTGLVTMSNNLGRFYIPGVNGEPTTVIELSGPTPREGAVGTTAQFSAELSAAGAVLPNMPIVFGIGQDIRLGWTGSSGADLGIATVDIPLLGTSPGEYDVTIAFPGNAAYAQSSAETLPFTVVEQDTVLTLDQAEVNVGSLESDVPLYAILTDAEGRPLAEKTVTFIVQDGGLVTMLKAVITDPLGRARLGRIDFPAAVEYTVSAKFEGTGSYNPSQTASSSIIKFNSPPVCDNVFVETTKGKEILWPANNKMVGIVLDGATDPDGDSLIYRFLEIYQDEEVGGTPDGSITNSCSDSKIRAQRDGNGDGRVYHIFFEVDDGNGGTCTGETTIATIPHDQGGTGGIDGGPLYNSLGDGVPACIP